MKGGWFDGWHTAAVAGVAATVVLSAAAGFVLLPALQGDGTATGLWARICGAAGASSAGSRGEKPLSASFATSEVVPTSFVPSDSDAGSVGRGATLAIRCTSCHGARGLSDAASPNLAGQYASAVYKQLRDFGSGARTSAVMGPRVANLTDADLRDLAAYYAYLPRPPIHQPEAQVPAIVASGAPMRNVPPCGACHGPDGHTSGSPSLSGEPYVYLSTQLGAFASGTRHNDISAQMRNVARGMSERDIEAAAAFYAQGS